ncbi:phage holin family protein [Ilumatobacter nonamiensis]|uniref:phage holin family protein n=1 Tax=Ilumatobacter nonamiensis TaxID=467093 RepID=UPI0003459CD9|nr:phage holin family protein [Ilumatobacter nonamiensis]
MPDTSDQTRTVGTKKPDDASLGEVIEFVKSYAKQETVGPLKGAGRWLGYGAGAALAMGLGLVLILFGILRVLQTEVDRLSTGSLSWAAYAITLVITIILLAITLQRVKKSTLNKEPK